MDQRARGFTLIEMMVVLALMAIILGLGIPSFRNLIEKIAVESEAKMIVEGLRTARLTAIEEKTNVVLCASDNGTSCVNAWDSGFIVYRDSDNSGTLNGTEEVLFSHRFKDSVLVKTGSGQNQSFFFNNNGWSPGSADSLLVCAEASTNRNAYAVIINRAGRLRILDSSQDWDNRSC